MLQRKTILLLLAAIAFGGIVLLIEGNRQVTSQKSADSGLTTPAGAESGAEATRQDTGELLFPFAEDAVESFEIERPTGNLAFTQSESGFWQMVQPETGLAEEGAIAFLLSQLTGPATRTLNIEKANLSDFGLENPDSTVTLTADGQQYQLSVGSTDFRGDQLYVQAKELPAGSAEPSAADESISVTVHVVSGGLINAINRPTEDWLIAAAPEPETSETEAPETEAPETEVPEPEASEPEAPETEASETEDL